MRRIFYSSPVDHRNLANWPALAERIRRAVSKACPGEPPVDAAIGTEPIFGHDIEGADADIEETLLGLEDLYLEPRSLRIDLWCSLVHYGIVCVTHGSGLVRKERRALDKVLAKALRGETCLRETEGSFDRHEGRVYGYALDPDDDRDLSTIAHLMAVFNAPVYVGERWLLQNAREELDEEHFFLLGPAGGGIVRFMSTDQIGLKPGEHLEAVWRNAVRGQGLVAAYDDDPDLDEIERHFGRFDDLRRFVGAGWNYRLTLGRGLAEDSLVVVYDLETGLLEGERPLFVL